MSGQIAVYDLVLPANENWEEHKQQIVKVFKDYAKKWCFQLEEGDSGYKHFQGRFSLIKKRAVHVLQPLLRAEPGFEKCFGNSLTPTFKENATNMFYVMKKDTRIEGPWKDEDNEESKVMTKQLRHFLSLDMWDWQLCCIEMAKQIDFRSIKLIYDQGGNHGKSILCEYMEYFDIAYEVPPFRQMEDLMQCVMGVKTYPCYIIDMPRGMKKDKLGEFYAGIECIKNGVAYDKRYKFEKKRFDRPQVIVFTNMLPDFDLLSRDRWTVYEIQDTSLRRMPMDTAVSFDEGQYDPLEPTV